MHSLLLGGADMPDGQNGVLENLDLEVNDGVNVLSPLTAPFASTPQFERPSFVLNDYKWGSGTRGTSGGTITWAVVTTGQSYPTDADYTSAAQPISSVFLPTIRAAFNRWDEVGNFSFVETTSPMTADMVLIFDELQAQSPDTIGLANTWTRGPVISNSYLSFDINRRYRLVDGSLQTVGSSPASGTLDLYTLVLHEVGHALGLDHEDDEPTIMNTTDDPNVTDLTSDDIAGIRAIYGTPSTADDFAASTATTGVLTVGATLTGTIGTAGDVDWVRVSLTSGVLYRFDARGSASSGGSLTDPYLQILNSSGTALFTDNDSGAGADARLMFRPSTTGTYYLGMRANSASATGTYTLAATANPDDYAATTATTGTVAVGATAEGLIETAGDRDWFRTTLTAGTTYTIRVTGTATGSAVRWTDSAVVLRNSGGTQVGANTRSGLGASAALTFTPTTTGTYFIDARAYSAGVGSYTVSVATGSAQTAELPASMKDYVNGEGVSPSDLAAVMAPPAVSLDQAPRHFIRTTILVDGALTDLVTPPPADLFSSEESVNPMTALPRLDLLFPEQPGTPYTPLPF